MTRVKRLRGQSLWVGVSVAVLLTGCSTAPPKYRTTLTGEKEVPPVTTTAGGVSDISVRLGKCPSTVILGSDCYLLGGMVQTSGVDGTAAHVHQGAPGQNGPVIVPLEKTGSNLWTVPVGTVLTDAQYQAYLAGNLYVNVHSDANKNGEIRAQIVPQ